MTEAEEKQRKEAMASCGYFCEVCGKNLTYANMQGAHRIANTKANRKKWGDFVINHPLNIAIVCSLPCNDKCNIGNNPGKCFELIEKIIQREKKRF